MIKYKCLACGRDKFDRKYQPHNCNGQFRIHKFPVEFIEVKKGKMIINEKIKQKILQFLMFLEFNGYHIYKTSSTSNAISENYSLVNNEMMIKMLDQYLSEEKEKIK